MNVLQRVARYKTEKMLSTALAAVVALVAMGFDSARAQGTRAVPSRSGEYAIDDQPGLVPNPREEQLTLAYQRQVVFYRTTEPAGTIIVDTADRYLYLIQGNNR